MDTKAEALFAEHVAKHNQKAKRAGLKLYHENHPPMRLRDLFYPIREWRYMSPEEAANFRAGYFQILADIALPAASKEFYRAKKDKRFSASGSKAKKEIATGLRTKINSARDAILKARTRPMSQRALAKQIAKMLGMQWETVRGHLKREEREKRETGAGK